MFRPSSTQPRDLNIIRTNWPSGSTIGLRIAAVDASGKQIAISIEERKYLVAIPL
jgi:hypothetical protein